MTNILNFVDEESATQAIETVAEIAGDNCAHSVLVGGLAMALYGSDRTTKDIETIADKLLLLDSAGLLPPGGERYIIKTNKKSPNSTDALHEAWQNTATNASTR